MFYYLIIGVILIDGQRRQEINERVGSKKLVDSERGRQAMVDTAILQATNCIAACEWIDGPHIQDLPQDQLMRLIGAPTLPGLEGAG